MSALFTPEHRADPAPRQSPWRPGPLWLHTALVAGACMAAGLAAPTWLAAPLVAAAAATTVYCAMLHSRRTGVERIAYATAGLLVTLVLVGLGLDVVPGGITRVSWSVALGVVAVAILVSSARHAQTGRATVRAWSSSWRGRHLARGSWYLTAGLVAALAIGISVHAAHVAERPPVHLSLVGTKSGTATVAIDGGSAGGRFRLVAHTIGTTRSAPFTVRAGQTRRMSVDAPTGLRTIITLHRVGPSPALLTLIVYGGQQVTGGSTSGAH